MLVWEIDLHVRVESIETQCEAYVHWGEMEILCTIHVSSSGQTSVWKGNTAIKWADTLLQTTAATASHTTLNWEVSVAYWIKKICTIDGFVFKPFCLYIWSLCETNV